MTPAVQVEILDLRHFSASSLKPVLDAESRVWSERLHWDYRASARLLLQYLDSHVLPGFVALENGRVCGYVFCVYEGSKAVIGDVFALAPPGHPETALEIERRLLVHLVELLQHSPGIERIESQLLLHPHGTHAGGLAATGFGIFERLFMELELAHANLEAEPAPQLPPELEWRSWRDSDFAAAGRLISRAYDDHLDSMINDQYRSVSGSLRFLHNIVRFPGCGVFDPVASQVLAYRKRDELAGVLLCSSVRDDVGHVTQICIAQEYRKHGLGSWLLNECSRTLRRLRFRWLTLTVTRENATAVSLYNTRGFTTRHTFDAMVWNRTSPSANGAGARERASGG